MAKIFISYRREDSRYQASRLHTALKPHVADAQADIFIDIDNIPFGVDFEAYLDGKVAECEVLLAVISSGWLDARSDDGRRRLDNPNDFVRIEIASALKRGIPVVPVLLDGAPIPNAADLPQDLQPLSRRNGLTVSFMSFEADVERLVRGLPINVKAAVSEALFSSRKAGEEFRDAMTNGGQGPQMIVIPAGTFLMGSPASEEGRRDNEGPQHTVRIEYEFAVGKYQVTWLEYQAFVAAGGGRAPKDDGYGQGSRPVTRVSWNDAKRYAEWLSSKSAQAYRLLSEAEWEYAARAGTTAAFSFEAPISTDLANYNGRSVERDKSSREYRQKTTPVGSFPANRFGLFDMHGNVWEWVEDCYEPGYSVQPSDGRAYTTADCIIKVLRGGSWGDGPLVLRSAYRSRFAPNGHNGSIGFRVARSLP